MPFAIQSNLLFNHDKLLEYNKENACDWFSVESDDEGVNWWGKCWVVVDYKKYEFDFKLEVSKHL